VMVTAVLPPFAKIGAKIDALASSIGDATSLQGGTLLLTPLRGADGEIYAVAQGPITLGGYSAGGAGASVAKNHTAAGRLVNGASVEKEVPQDFAHVESIAVNLFRPDFTTAARLASVIGNAADGIEARQVDASTVMVRRKEGAGRSAADLVALIENLDVPIDAAAVVVMNEKTGTVVMGENVRISTVAVAHGNLSIQIKEDQKVSQPQPFAPRPPVRSTPVRKGGAVIAPGGQTVVTTDTTVGASEEKKQLVVVPQGVTIQDVVKALNAIGVTPRDLITILQTIKEAGALQAELRVI
jgi:flagellar P-ring protein FlgI